MSNSHEALFQNTFRDLSKAAALLKRQLSKELQRKIDWGSLQLCPDHFAKTKGKQFPAIEPAPGRYVKARA